MTVSTACKSGWCWRKGHGLCLGDWISDTHGTLFRCICECHGPDRLTPVTAGADLGHDLTYDEGDGGMGSGKWLELDQDYDPAYPQEENNGR